MSDDVVIEPAKRLVVRWGCGYCRRSYSSRTRTVEHMGRCWYNPAVRSCKTCVHFRGDRGGGESCRAGVAIPIPGDIEGRTTLPTGCSLWVLLEVAS